MRDAVENLGRSPIYFSGNVWQVNEMIERFSFLFLSQHIAIFLMCGNRQFASLIIFFPFFFFSVGSFVKWDQLSSRIIYFIFFLQEERTRLKELSESNVREREKRRRMAVIERERGTKSIDRRSLPSLLSSFSDPKGEKRDYSYCTASSYCYTTTDWDFISFFALWFNPILN